MFGFNFGRPTAAPGRSSNQLPFIRSFKAYSAAFAGKPEVNKGNKILLPPSALHELARLQVSYPMTFMVSNPQVGIKTHVGVLEFVAEEGICYLPLFIMNNLLLEEGSEVIIRNVTITKGSFVSLQPHETAFIDLANPKAILERELRNYSCLTKGETILISYADRDYLIDIVECRPQDAICVVEADIEVDFKPPLDYKEIPLTKKKSILSFDDEENKKNELDNDQSWGQFARLDGKPLTAAQKKKIMSQKEEAAKKEDEFDPRKHRLVHGIRNYKPIRFEGKGTKIGL